MGKIKIKEGQKKLVENGILALATADPTGEVNVVAVACAKVVADDKILMTDNFMNKTRKNLLANNRAAVAVWSKNEDEGYQFKGIAQYLTSGKWKKRVDEDPDNKGLAHKAAVLLTINEIWSLMRQGLIGKR